MFEDIKSKQSFPAFSIITLLTFPLTKSKSIQSKAHEKIFKFSAKTFDDIILKYHPQWC